MPTDLPPDVAARAHRATDSLHSMIYFAPEADEEYVAVGLRSGRMGYFASRSAAMGAVSAAVTTATFYNFNPELVARFIPAAWALAQPEAILAARLVGADRALRRMLGEEVVASAELAEAAALAREACLALRPEGRPLYAAHAELPWPEQPHLVLWQAATVLREYRGDGHLAALLEADLSGLEAIYTHTLTGRGFAPEAAKKLRGWSDEQWVGVADALRDKGFVDDGGLTAAGRALRDQVETTTDRLDQAAWLHLGPDRTERLIELGKGLTRVIVGNGAFSAPGVFAGAR